MLPLARTEGETVMMKTATVAASLSLMALLTVPAAAQSRIDNRQDRQETRIDNGIAQGQITPREAARLNAQQRSINRYEKRSRIDGPGLTRVERARIENKQDRASRSIARQRRD
jgi:hypothetical protein